MAKEKKSESAKAPAAKKSAGAAKAKSEPAAAAKKSAPAAAAKKSGKPAGAGAGQAPLIDTGLAAATAAAMVASRLAGGGASGQRSGGTQESSSFKSLKDSINKPNVGSLGGILGTAAGQKKSGAGFGPKQSGPAGGSRNQTFGADVNRTGVPRRTSG